MRKNDNDNPIVFVDDDEIELPWKWEICPCCEGHGTDRGRSVECEGGGFTSSEWAEQDDDFRQDYLAGVYDKPCNECGGSGKIKVADEERCNPDLWKLYQKQVEDDAEYERECAWERRMGC